MKHVYPILNFFVALLASLMARGDVIFWTPPNTYEGFLYRQGYYRGTINEACNNAVLYGLPVCIGVVVLTLIFCRLRKKRFPRAKLAIVASIFICVVVGLGVAMMKCYSNCKDLFMRGPPPDYSPVVLLDTKEHRKFTVKLYGGQRVFRGDGQRVHGGEY